MFLLYAIDHDIPLCGIPYFAIDNYLKKVIRRGLKVAVCEQTEVCKRESLHSRPQQK